MTGKSAPNSPRTRTHSRLSLVFVVCECVRAWVFVRICMCLSELAGPCMQHLLSLSFSHSLSLLKQTRRVLLLCHLPPLLLRHRHHHLLLLFLPPRSPLLRRYPSLTTPSPSLRSDAPPRLISCTYSALPASSFFFFPFSAFEHLLLLLPVFLLLLHAFFV